MKCILAAAALVAMATPAFSQGACMPLEAFNSKVMSVFGEQPIATGRADKNTVRLYVDLDDLSFTIAALTEDRKTICIIATGDRFRPMIPEDTADEPAIAPGKGRLNISVIPKNQAEPRRP